MNDNIKEKAQKLYPISENAECYTAFLQGASVAQQELIEKTCEYFQDVLYEVTTGVTHDPDVMSVESTTMEDFINNFRKAMER